MDKLKKTCTRCFPTVNEYLTTVFISVKTLIYAQITNSNNGSPSNNFRFGRQSQISDNKYWSRDQNQTRTIELIKTRTGFPPNPKQSSVPMAGKTKYLHQNWKVLTKDQYVCHVVQGTTLDFIQTPLPFKFSIICQSDRNRSSRSRNKIIVIERAIKVVKDKKGFFG